MRRLLTAGIFGTILGIVGAGTANASIVSSGFLDEKLTEMTNATTLQLDGKANQIELTALSNKIGIDRWNTGNGNLEYNAFPFTVDLFPEFRRSSEGWAGEGSDEHSITYYMVANNTDINVPGLAGVTNKLLNGWTNEYGSRINPGLRGMFNGWTNSAGETYQGIKALNEGWTDKNGSNPGIKGMFDGWTVEGGTYFPGLYSYSKGETLLQRAYDSDNSGLDFSRLLINGANSTTIDRVDYTGPVYPLWKLSQGIGTLPSGYFPGFPGYEFLFTENNQPPTYPTSLAELITAIYGNSETGYAGLLEAIIAGFPFNDRNDNDYIIGIIPNFQLAKNADEKIGTLPTGTPLVLTDSMENLNERLGFKYTIHYPKSLSDLIVDLYGATDPSNPGLLSLFTSAIADMVWPHEEEIFGSSSNNKTGLLERMDNVETKIGKIGTLPSAILPSMWTAIPYYTQAGGNIPDAGIPLPTTIGEQLEFLFGGEMDSPIDRMFRVITLAGNGIAVGTLEPGTNDPQAEFLGLNPLTQKVRSIDAKIGTVPDGKNLAGMISETDAKIGTLPAGYDSVGAALSAIKGIAEDAKAAALAAIPDPKQEGSSGKYVLTVDIVGDNATYHWEKIDREGETTTTE